MTSHPEEKTNMPAATTMPVSRPSDENDDLPVVLPDDAARAAPADDAGWADPGMSPAAQAALAVAGRLEALLREEIGLLRGASVETLRQMNHRKSQCLLELSRAARALGDEPAPPELAAGLDRLKQVVSDNQDTLSTHIVAVRDIAGLIAEVMQAHESDGTYADRPAPRPPLGGEHAADTGGAHRPDRKGATP